MLRKVSSGNEKIPSFVQMLGAERSHRSDQRRQFCELAMCCFLLFGSPSACIRQAVCCLDPDRGERASSNLHQFVPQRYPAPARGLCLPTHGSLCETPRKPRPSSSAHSIRSEKSAFASLARIESGPG